MPRSAGGLVHSVGSGSPATDGLGGGRSVLRRPRAVAARAVGEHLYPRYSGGLGLYQTPSVRRGGDLNGVPPRARVVVISDAVQRPRLAAGRGRAALRRD